MMAVQDCKLILQDQPSPHLQEQSLAQAEADGYDAWALAEMVGVRAELWA